jgi:hypothetical protein
MGGIGCRRKSIFVEAADCTSIAHERQMIQAGETSKTEVEFGYRQQDPEENKLRGALCVAGG